jgi:hypothetical protein
VKGREREGRVDGSGGWNSVGCMFLGGWNEMRDDELRKNAECESAIPCVYIFPRSRLLLCALTSIYFFTREKKAKRCECTFLDGGHAG